ncbi:glutathione S-transferase family protein [Cochlodiniinecator piscidefendens]|uniref:glutathione S-transferase family protein n=1 Tax=Cochlodiniinecator piscidefendens TaxID=2715756 RepID=UPI001407DBF3|nr:glutathione S-transferase family protein [Cochlodiniinecator piscidefendens]
MIKLHCFGESGNAYKAALALQLSGLEWEAVYVDFFNGATRTPEFLAINPLGEVPCLVDGDECISQSGVIQMYISEKSGKFGGVTPAQQREVLRWVFWDNHKLSSMAGNVRYFENFAPKSSVPEGYTEMNKARLTTAYKTLNRALDGNDWLVGDSITNADISCCGYLFYPEPFGFNRTDFPNIDAWLDRISEQPGWKHPYDLMPGHPSDRA